MSLVNRDLLRTNYEQLAATLSSDDAAGLVRPSVTARLLGNVTAESTFVQYDRPFRFIGDEAIIRGGREEGPSPMRYFLSGIAFCLEGWYAKGSAFADVDIEALELELRTYMDMRGEHGLPDVPPHPQWIVAEVRATSPSPPENVLAMVDWGDVRCPLGSLVRRAIPVYGRVIHNGTLIRDEVPANLA
jgi:uncharacterized OsmC-like protein